MRKYSLPAISYDNRTISRYLFIPLLLSLSAHRALLYQQLHKLYMYKHIYKIFVYQVLEKTRAVLWRYTLSGDLANLSSHNYTHPLPLINLIPLFSSIFHLHYFYHLPPIHACLIHVSMNAALSPIPQLEPPHNAIRLCVGNISAILKENLTIIGPDCLYKRSKFNCFVNILTMTWLISPMMNMIDTEKRKMRRIVGNIC